MIGHFLLTLTECQEDRALTTSMRPGSYTSERGPCLVGATVYPELDHSLARSEQMPQLGPWNPVRWSDSVEYHYDRLCERFGERVNIAIRNRILSNRARRVLKSQSEAAVLVGERTT